MKNTIFENCSWVAVYYCVTNNKIFCTLEWKAKYLQITCTCTCMRRNLQDDTGRVKILISTCTDSLMYQHAYYKTGKVCESV